MSTQRSDCIDPICNRDGTRTNDAAAAACSLLSLSVLSGLSLLLLLLQVAGSGFTATGQEGFAGRRWRDKAGLGGVSSLSCTPAALRLSARGGASRSGGAVGPVLWSKVRVGYPCATPLRACPAVSPCLLLALSFHAAGPRVSASQGRGNRGGHASGKETTPPRVIDLIKLISPISPLARLSLHARA